MTVIQLHAYDVVHSDFYLRNILLYQSEEQAFNFVIVDFGIASSIRYMKEVEDQWWCAEITNLQEMLEEELDFDDTVCKWMETKNGKRLWDLVQKDSDELAAMCASGEFSGQV
jgi:tRNA A-37 threonylcarbamoyl transferase component Bud32